MRKLCNNFLIRFLCIIAILVLLLFAFPVSADSMVPQKPSGNYDYRESFQINSLYDSVTEGTYENGTFKITTTSDQKLIPFNFSLKGTDSFVYQAKIKQITGEEEWHGVRLVLSSTADFVTRSTFALFENQFLVVNKASGMGFSGSAPKQRILGQNYAITLFYDAGVCSVWIDGELVLDKNKADVLPSVIYPGLEVAVTQAEISDISIYKTTSDPANLHSKDENQGGSNGKIGTGTSLPPNRPVPKPLDGNSDLLPDSYTVTATDGNINCGYIDGVFKNTNAMVDSVVLFDPFKALKYDSSYRIQYKLKINEANANEQYDDSESPGPRMIFRAEGTTTYLGLAFCKNHLWIFNCYNGEQSVLKEVDFKRELGKVYDVVICSDPNRVRVWIDNVFYFDESDLPTYSPRFGGQLYRTSIEISDITVYDMAENHATVDDKKAEYIETGNTLKNGSNNTYKNRFAKKLILVSAVAFVSIVAVALLTVFILLHRKKEDKNMIADLSDNCETEDENKLI